MVVGALGQGARARAQERAQRSRNPAGEERGPELVVAREHLVAAVSVEGDRDLPPRLPRDEVGGQGRGVAEGLVVVMEQRLQELGRVGGHHGLVVLGPQVARDLGRVRALVEVGVALEADGEGLDAPGHEIAT